MCRNDDTEKNIPFTVGPILPPSSPTVPQCQLYLLRGRTVQSLRYKEDSTSSWFLILSITLYQSDKKNTKQN